MPWISFKAGFVCKPDVDRFILKQIVELLAECFALLLVLAVWPWLWHLKGKALIVKKAHNRSVATLRFIGL